MAAGFKIKIIYSYKTPGNNMAKQYQEYSTRFREHSAQIGFRYTFSQLLSAIPAAIGHGIDTAIGLDNVFIKDKSSHLNGPFGLFLGILPYLLGLISGEILQQIFNIPMYIGYGIDKLLSLCFTPIVKGETFDKQMVQQMRLAMIHALYTAATQTPPNQMLGPFGFFLGVIPQTLRVAIHRIAEVITCVTLFITDHITDGIRAVYSKLSNAIFGPKKIKEKEIREEEPSESQSARRIKRSYKEVRVDQETLDRVKEWDLNLYEVLGIAESANNKDIEKAFRKKSQKCHPDKNSSNEAAIEWEKVNLAKSILANSAAKKIYISWYQESHPLGFFSKPATPTLQKTENTSGDPTTKPLVVRRIQRQ